MKKGYIFALAAVSLSMALASCSEKYEDASSIHVYGPDENPPVKADPAFTTSGIFEMNGGQTDPVVFNIYDYEPMFQKAFGQSAKEVVSKLGSEYVVAPINPNRMVWLKDQANTGDKYGWYVSKTGNVCSSDDANLYGKVKYNETNGDMEFYIDPNGGGSVGVQIGIAKLGPNYNTHVRFVFNVTAYDKSYAFIDFAIPAGDYNAYELQPSELAENIEYVFGMSPDQFVNAIINGQIALYMIDHNTNSCMWNAESTANNGGFWCNDKGEVISWGAGCAYYIEPWLEEDEPSIAIGRYPGIEPGTVHEIKFGFADVSNHAKVLSVIATATYE